MKLVIFGLTMSSSWGNGHATLWRGLCRALIRQGHEVVFFERDVPYYALHRDMTDLPGGKLILYTDWVEALPIAEAELADADVGMVTSYCPDGILATQAVLSSPARLRCFYDLDTPITLKRRRTGDRVAYLGSNGLADFDFVLSYTGGESLEALQTELGARRVAPLYGSVDIEVHRPVGAVEDFRGDLSYLGTYAADRQDQLRALLIEPARRLPDKKFVIGGAQYPSEFPWSENIYFVRHIAPPDHPSFYCSARFTLNVTRQAMAEAGYCPSGRLFEAAACATPIISDYWEGLEQFYEPGVEIIVARSTEEAIHALGMHEDERLEIARAGRERTLREHTSEQRAHEMVEVLKEALGERGTAKESMSGDLTGSTAAAGSLMEA